MKLTLTAYDNDNWEWRPWVSPSLRHANIGEPNVLEDMMENSTEYLVIKYARDGSIVKQLRTSKSVNLRLLLERLVCQDLDDDAVINSCLRSNAKRFYDPFQVIDMREEYRREQARDAFSADPETHDPIGVYNRARAAQIPLGKTLMIAGANHDYFVKEVKALRISVRTDSFTQNQLLSTET